MPIYVYKCSKCEKEVEELQKLEEPPPPRCSSCLAEGSMEKKLGMSNFQLVGSGWAKDGYS